MLAAAPDAGIFYVCSPNNPTGTLTSHADIEYLLENKPKGSVVMVDEAYIHFCDAPTALDLVKADKDVIVLRTFSKIYGMAGLRCGFAVGRPDLIKKLNAYGGWNAMPVTAVAAAIASMKDATLVPDRKRINTETRQTTFAWLDSNGYEYSPSVSNCFMLKAGKPAHDVIAAMAHQNVYHRTPLALGARLGPNHRGYTGGDAAVPGGLPGGDEGIRRRPTARPTLLYRNLDGMVVPG